MGIDWMVCGYRLSGVYIYIYWDVCGYRLGGVWV